MTLCSGAVGVSYDDFIHALGHSCQGLNVKYLSASPTFHTCRSRFATIGAQGDDARSDCKVYSDNNEGEGAAFEVIAALAGLDAGQPRLSVRSQ